MKGNWIPLESGIAVELSACRVQSAAGLQPVPSFEGCNVF